MCFDAEKLWFTVEVSLALHTAIVFACLQNCLSECWMTLPKMAFLWGFFIVRIVCLYRIGSRTWKLAHKMTWRNYSFPGFQFERLGLDSKVMAGKHKQ